MDRKGSHQGRQRVGGLLGLLRLCSPVPLSLGNYIFLTGHPKMVGGWRQVLERAQGKRVENVPGVRSPAPGIDPGLERYNLAPAAGSYFLPQAWIPL